MNYEDSSGTYHRSLDSGIRSVSYEAPGTKGTALAQYMQGTSPYGKLNVNITGEQVWTAARYLLSTGASVCFGMVYSLSKPVTFFFDAISVYDECRYAGLDADISLLTSIVCATVTNKPQFLAGNDEGFFSVFSSSIASDLFKDWMIAVFMPEPNDAMQNRIQHMSQKSGLVTVGGSLRFTHFTDEWRDGISVRP